jgi:hypothetical protein
MSSGFYVTLPSTSSSREMPDNTQTNFTTLFHPAIQLSQSHEVALVEITYSTHFLVDLGVLTIRNPFCLPGDTGYGRFETLDFKIEAFNGSSTLDVLTKLNTAMFQRVIKEEYEFRQKLDNHDLQVIQRLGEFYLSTEKLAKPKLLVFEKENDYEIYAFNQETYNHLFGTIDLADKRSTKPISFDDSKRRYTIKGKNSEEINKYKNVFDVEFIKIPEKFYDIESFYMNADLSAEIKNPIHYAIAAQLKDESKKIKRSLPHFSYSDNRVRIIYDCDIPYSFNELASAVFTNQTKELSATKSRSFLMPSTLNTVNHAMILTDIIEDQFYGDTKSPVLYTLNLKSSSQAEMVTVFDNPHYLPVNKSFISSINIQLFDLTGTPIKFTDLFSIIILTLHFRKAKYE